MPINTLFQLMAEDNNGASLMLFMPDLFAYALCGAKMQIKQSPPPRKCLI